MHINPFLVLVDLINCNEGYMLPRKSARRVKDQKRTLDSSPPISSTKCLKSASYNLVRTTEQLYVKATSAVQMNGSIGEWFRITVGVRQECLLSPTLFNIFLERIMSDALEEHDVKVSIGGRNITKLRLPMT